MKITATNLVKFSDKATLAMSVGSIIVVYILDGIFFGSLVAFGFLTAVFVLLGLVLRTGAVFLDVYIATVKRTMKDNSGNLLPEAKTALVKYRCMWVFCVVACLLSAINFFAAGHADKALEATDGKDVAEVQLASKEVRIARLETKKQRIINDRDAAVEDAQENIIAIRDDGVRGISAADNISIQKLESEKRQYRNDATIELDKIDEKIAAIEDEQETAQISKAKSENISETWEVFVWLGEHTPLSVDTWSNGGLFYLAMLIEALAALALGAYVASQQFFKKALSRLEIEDEIHQIENDAELASAKIRAEALKRSLADKAEEEAAALNEPNAPKSEPTKEVPPSNNPGAKLGGLSTGMNKASDKQDNRITVPSGVST